MLPSGYKRPQPRMQRPGQPGVVPEVLIACGGHDEEFLDLVDLIDGDGDDVFPASSDEEDEDLHEQPPEVPEVMPVVFFSASNCTTTLLDVRSSEELFGMFPEFHSNSRWITFHVPTNTALSGTRCIDGSSLVVQCRLPGHKACKMHLNVLGNFPHCEAQCSKWSIAGFYMSPEQHASAAAAVSAAWRASRGYASNSA